MNLKWTDSTEHTLGASGVAPTQGKKNDRSRSTKKWFSRLDQLNYFLPSCPNLSNCQSECEVCCSDVNVIFKSLYCTQKISDGHIETDLTPFRKPAHSTLQAEVSLTLAWLLA